MPPAASPLAGILLTSVHTSAYLAVTGLIAWVVYRKLGLALIRTAWLNFDVVWAAALVAPVLSPFLYRGLSSSFKPGELLSAGSSACAKASSRMRTIHLLQLTIERELLITNAQDSSSHSGPSPFLPNKRRCVLYPSLLPTYAPTGARISREH